LDTLKAQAKEKKKQNKLILTKV